MPSNAGLISLICLSKKSDYDGSNQKVFVKERKDFIEKLSNLLISASNKNHGFPNALKKNHECKTGDR